MAESFAKDPWTIEEAYKVRYFPVYIADATIWSLADYIAEIEKRGTEQTAAPVTEPEAETRSRKRRTVTEPEAETRSRKRRTVTEPEAEG